MSINLVRVDDPTPVCPSTAENVRGYVFLACPVLLCAFEESQQIRAKTVDCIRFRDFIPKLFEPQRCFDRRGRTFSTDRNASVFSLKSFRCHLHDATSDLLKSLALRQALYHARCRHMSRI
jgi:hypothetical protein